MKTFRRPRFVSAGLVVLCSAMPLLADYSNTVAGFNPLGYWRLDETATSPALNILSNLGSVGSPGDGIVDRQVTKGQAGIVGNSILLDNPGSGSIACYAKVDVPFTAALNPSAPFSVEFWAKPRRTDSTLCAISSINCYWNGGASRTGWLIYQDTTRWQFRLGGNSAYAMTTQCSSPAGSATTAAFQHIVATYDGTTAKLYVNGAQAASLVVNWTTPNTSLPLMMGALTLSGGGASTVDGPAITAQGLAGYRGWDGWLDEVAIYPSALSATAVANHYTAASTPATYGTTIQADGPLGYWNFDEPAVAPPDPGTFPIAVNSGTVGSALNGTNWWGALAAQTGAGYAGLGAGNKSCFFDGDNGYIALGDDPAMHFTGQITMMAWVKPMSKNYFRNIIGHGWDDIYAETFLRLSQGDDSTLNSDGNMYYETGISLDGTQAGYNTNVARYVIPEGDVGNWVFLAGTYDGSKWNLYRNGQLVASTVTPNGAIDVTNRWSIGSRSSPSPTDGSAFYGTAATFESEGLVFHGYVDEPAIFNTALAAPDISAIYNAAQVPPVISRAVVVPADAYKGSSGDFSVWAEGSPTLGYQWTSNGISTGATTTNLTLNSLAAGNLTVAVVVTNAYGSATSSVTFLVVASKPLITQQPQAISRYIGRPFSFSVAAAGTAPISYQWNTNGIPIPGATSSGYTGVVSAASALDYSVTLTNEAGSSNSATVALTAVPLPTGYGAAAITDDPVAYWRLGETSGTVAYDYYGGQNGAYFGATLGQSGYSELDADKAVAFDGVDSYVGNVNGDPATGGINFQGHVNFTLEAWVNGPAGQAEQAAIIAKGIGQVNTTANEQFVLDVGSDPSSGNQAFRFFTRGNANGAFPVYADIGPDGNWHHIVGVYDDLDVLGLGVKMHIFVDGELRASAVTRASGLRASTDPVSIGSKRLGNDPHYDGTFNGIVDEVAVYSYALTPLQISNHYALAYGPSTKPTITRQPVSQTVYESSPVPPKFEVGAFGTQPLSYQWKKGGLDLVDGGNISGATTRALTISDVTLSDAGNYSVTINNSVGPETNSTIATLTVTPAPTNVIFVPGLVLHLPLDGNLNDMSGRGNHGAGMRTTFTSTNTAVPAANSGVNPDFYYESAGKLGQALHYHTATTNGALGAVSNAYFVTLGDKADFRFSSNVDFSFSYWVRFPRFDGVGDLGDLPFLATAINSYGNPGITLAPSYQLGSWSYSLNGVAQVYGLDYLLDDGTWHHLAHTFHRDGVGITYVDGKQVDVRSITTAGDLDTGNPLTIGQDPSGKYMEEGYYDIDDIGIWRRALTSFEVVGIYLAATLANSSFIDIAPVIAAGPGANQVTVTWPAGVLQSATSVSGPYTDVPGATSPHVVTPSGATFYRTRY